MIATAILVSMGEYVVMDYRTIPANVLKGLLVKIVVLILMNASAILVKMERLV